MRLLPALAFMALLFYTCNPDCDSLQNVRISSNLNPEGYEVLITASPISALKGKKVGFGNQAATTRFVEDFGLIVKVPSGVSGATELKIEDPDCLDVFSFDFNVVDGSYFNSNIDFVPPASPEIVIPVPPISFPGNIDNAWLSPNNVGYCLWFTMFKDTIDGRPIESKLVDPDNSFEQATCACLRGSSLPYANNYMGGIVDRENNIIDIYIDRTDVPGGDVEEFTGMFIPLSSTQYASNLGLLNCPVDCPFPLPMKETGDYMMLLTSKKTGRQVVAFQLKLQ